MNVACNKHRRDVEVAFDMPDEQFGRSFRLSEATVLRLRSNSPIDSRLRSLGGAAKVCFLRFFATGSFQSSVKGEETVAVMQPTVSICVRRVSREIVNAMTRNNRVHFRRTVEEEATVKEEFLRFGPVPGVIECVDGRFVASRSDKR
nr:uncharacterized protein LOC119179029 [Rhipicephalus microplus]